MPRRLRPYSEHSYSIGGSSGMNTSNAKNEMQAVVVGLVEHLANAKSDGDRSRMIGHARREIERIQKTWKHRIDERAQQKAGKFGYRGFAINEREGIERSLAAAS